MQGAGTNHWYHSDQVYRTFLSLPMLCGCEGVNAGGWAHYVGLTGSVIGMKTFGASAPLKELQKKFGFTTERVVQAAKEQLKGKR